MKRWMLRLSALSGIVVLGLIAIAQAQRSAPADNSDDAAPTAAERDPFAIRPDQSAPQRSLDEPRRLGGDTPAASNSLDERPVKRLRNIVREAAATGDSNPPEFDRAAVPSDPFNGRGRSAAGSPQRLLPAKEAAELPNDDASGAAPHGKRASAPSDARSIFSGAGRYANGNGNGLDSRPAPANRFEDRNAKPLDAATELGPSLAPAGGAAPSPFRSAEAQATVSDGVTENVGVHSAPYGGTSSVMKHSGTPSNALRPLATEAATPLDPANAVEGTGRPGTKQLEGAQSPHLTVEKTAPPEVQVGKPAKFEIKVRNSGSVTAQGVEIHDEIPKGTQLVSTNPTATTGPHGELVWTLGTLNPGEQVTAQLELMPVSEGEIGSVASVSFRADASARTVATKPQLMLQVSAPKQVMIGSDVTLTIRLSNPGSGTAGGVVLAERVPPGLRHPAGNELEFEVGALKPGESRQIELTMSASQAGRVVNSLVARGEGSLKAEEKAEFEVVAPLLNVAMSGPTRRYLERQAVYTVSVSNPGTAPAKDIQLVTQLPKGLKFVKANNSGQYDPNTNSVVWSLEELPAAETGSVTLVAVPIEVGEQKMKVQGKARQGLSDEKEQTVVVEGLAALSFDVKAADEAIEIGGETTYQIHVVNQGSKAASNVQIAAEFPAELEATRAEGPSKETVEDHRVQFEPLARLAPKADATFRIRAQALAAGDLRIKVQLLTDDSRQPITKEESTRVYTDQ
jgi:uncharacterized repeat protein (TIGR01451 family)